jgi:hypothetical protein
VKLYSANGTMDKMVHQLVGLHFVDNPNNFTQIDHIDQTRNNNHYKNLRWVNTRLNMGNRKDQSYLGVNIRETQFGTFQFYTRIPTEMQVGGVNRHYRSFRNIEDAIIYRDIYLLEHGLLE